MYSRSQEGKNYGDEYLAELDYIEVVESTKEGYEAEAVEDDLNEGKDPEHSDRITGHEFKFRYDFGRREGD